MSPAEVVRLEVSTHAAARFVERRGAPNATQAEAELLQMAAEGKEVVPPAGWAIEEEIGRHGAEADARYIRSGGWLLILRDRRSALVVVTVYRPETWWW